MEEKIYSPQQFGRLIGRSVATLQRWDRQGILKAYRSPTNRRFYTHSQYLAYLGLTPTERSIEHVDETGIANGLS
jgi:putative resolvase